MESDGEAEHDLLEVRLRITDAAGAIRIPDGSTTEVELVVTAKAR